MSEKIKLRLVKHSGWVGEAFVFGDWEEITSSCFTKWGAKRQLMRWVKREKARKHPKIEEFEVEI